MSREIFDKAIDFTLQWEGGYVWDKDDSGGETKFGVAKRYHKDLDIINLTLEQAKEIYYRDYWLPASCDDFGQSAAICLFDASVNCGLHRAVQFLQRAINVLDDGILGSKTIKATESLSDVHIALSIIEQRKKYYCLKVTENPVKSKFLKGWINRCDALEKFIREI